MNKQKFRLENGGRINRLKPIKFNFDGNNYYGYEGDSLASALLANGVKLVARSFKYHRIRGILTNGADEPNGLAQIGKGARTLPNVKMTQAPIYEGMIAKSQNRFPSLLWDIGAINGLFGKILGAGFYYKTFMGPYHRAWMLWEWFIRRAAGLGKAPKHDEFDPDHYERVNYFCDVLVIGGDNSAFHAVRELAKTNYRVLFANPDLINDEIPFGFPDNVVYLSKTTIVAAHDSKVFIGYQPIHNNCNIPPEFMPREKMLVIHTQACVYAGGANELTLPFSNNDLPGVMKFHAAIDYIEKYAVLTGERAVIITNNNSIYDKLAVLINNGIKISAIIDMRREPNEADIAKANQHDIHIYANAYPTKAVGFYHVSGIYAGVINEDGVVQNATHFNADLVLVSGGFQPNTQLLAHRNVSDWEFSPKGDCFLVKNCEAGYFLCGASAGAIRPESHEASGIDAAARVKKYLKNPSAKHNAQNLSAVEPCFYDIISLSKLPKIGKKAFVDYQHDVVVDDIYLAAKEGYHFVEHLKRYTTMGMGTDQGRNGQEAALHILANILETARGEIGAPRMRPPIEPITLGLVAGHSVGANLKPKRFTPFHQFMVGNNAVMTEAGLWYRPWYYPSHKKEEKAEAYVREMLHVRTKVGICDVSTLGKIMVQGRDAMEFLDRIYVNNMASLPIGKCRYGVMLREDGVVLDDGTVWRLGDKNYMITTTTSNAGKVMDFLEELLAVYFTDLQLSLTSVSDQWGALSLAGPLSRQCLQRFMPDVDLSNEALPFMGIIKTKILGANMMIARISFSGELAYEIYIQSSKCVEILEALMFVGKDFDLQFYGLEALGGLRIEKGHPVGSELDGRTTLDDINLSKMAKKNKNFIGKFMMNRGVLSDVNRPKLVGLESTTQPILGGSIIQEIGIEPLLQGHGIGWVSSYTYSPILQKHIALGFVANGRNSHGKMVSIADPLRSGYSVAKIVSPHFYDPEGKKLHA